MSGNASDFLENKLLDHALKNTAYSRPTHLYLALCTADPTDAGDGSSITEPSGGSYARQIVDDWDSATGRATANSTSFSFPTATAGWGTITHFAVCDDLTGGNMLAHGALTASQQIKTNNTFRVAKGDFDISFNTGGMSNYLANELLDHVFAGASYSQPTSIFVALATASISDSDTGSTITEPGDTYERQEVNDWDAASGGASANTNQIDFPTASAGYGTITDFALTDDLTGGNMLFHGSLDEATEIVAGNTPTWSAGALDVTLD